MDILYPVRKPKKHLDGLNLKYSLRSIKNVPHGSVWIVGYKPDWVTNVNHIEYLPRIHKFRNTQNQLERACNNRYLSDEFMYFNDDFFILNPIEHVPNYHRGLLDEHPFLYESKSNHKKGGRSAMRFLKRMGYRNPLSYEVHTPMVVNKLDFLKAIKISNRNEVRPAFIRSIYGNLFDVEATEIQDVKVFKTYDTVNNKFPENNFISTNPTAWREGEMRQDLKNRFPEPCIYEKEYYL